LICECPRVVIAGTESGVGKTSLSVGLTRALVRRGLRVQPFKVGPDFLDPGYLSLAAGRPCYNLDGWITGRQYVTELFARANASADVAVIEGVMGMFDGASPTSSDGSTAEIAAWLDGPVVLAVNAQGVARSLAATVKGFVEFDPRISIAGVIANRIGSDHHRAWLAESLQDANLPPPVGAVPRGAFPELKSRHLGLLSADRKNIPAELIERLADGCERYLDIQAILEAARSAKPLAVTPSETPSAARKVRIGIPRDEAFHFYYCDNLEMMERHGAELVSFSPISDPTLPESLDGIYLGGGYPEEHAEALSSNHSMLQSVRRFAASGRPVYAECGGLMYLARELKTGEGKSYPLAGVLPTTTRMLPGLKSLGYVEIAMTEDSLWGPRGAKLRGHEFHYSELAEPFPADSGWQRVYSIERRFDRPGEREGFQKGNVLASYVHVHFASQPRRIEYFLHNCGESL
jgi:cobyrinic acid a,c-diamide synthase